jgi:hypothetical protein
MEHAMSHNLRIALLLAALALSGASLLAACNTADTHQEAPAPSQPVPSADAY